MRAGSRDTILVLHVKDGKLTATALPFAATRKDVPEYEVVENEKAAEVFGNFLAANYEEQIGNFDHGAYESEWAKVRETAIAAAKDGKVPEPIKVPEPEQDTGSRSPRWRRRSRMPASRRLSRRPRRRSRRAGRRSPRERRPSSWESLQATRDYRRATFNDGDRIELVSLAPPSYTTTRRPCRLGRRARSGPSATT